ncbi:MAG: hypothetical protein ABR607_12955 [Pyrinomonadaceae bacterium]
MKPLVVAVAALLLALTPLGHSLSHPQKNEAPRFQDYPADVWAGKATLLNVRSHALARTYRTRLREALRQEGINFAGQYTFATIGCGADCSINAIIDARTGQAYFPKELAGWSTMGTTDLAGQFEGRARADSRLLQIPGRPSIGRKIGERYGPGGVYYYEWINSQLRKVQFFPAAAYPKVDRTLP